MDTNTFNSQHVIISSMNDGVMDDFFDANNNVMNNVHAPFNQLIDTNLSPSLEFVSQTIAASSTSSSAGPQIISFENPTSATLGYGDHEKYYYGYTNNPMVVRPRKCHKTAEKFSLTLANTPPPTPSIQNHLEFTLGADLGYNRSRTSPITKTPQQARYYVEAERKRREKLSNLFISLSKVVPGLKKWDKVSVLEDAIKHMKELQERLKVLEEEEATKKNSTRTFFDHDHNDTMAETCITSSCTEQNETSYLSETFNNGTMELQLPDIKARILGKNVLIKILCDKKYYGCTLNITNELQKLHLAILDTRILHFGGCAIDVTFACQIESPFSMTVNEIVEHLQTALFLVHK